MNEFLTTDACKLKLNKKSVDLVITHPPYLGIDTGRYGGKKEKQINYKNNEKLMLWKLVKATQRMEKALKDEGSIFICLGGNQSLPHKYIAMVLKHTKLQFSGFIYWDYEKKESVEYERLNGQQSLWLHFIRGNVPPYFNDKVPLRNWYSNVVNNMQEAIDVELTEENNFVGDAYPIGIAHRLIQMFSPENATVLDPFGGSGITAQSALENGRSFITNDISLDATELAKKRIDLYLSSPEDYGTLST
jgi:DNA modification methylase